VRTPHRDRLREVLDREGIDTGVYYDPPLHKHILSEYCRMGGSLPQAEWAGSEILTLPIHAALPVAQARRSGSIVGEFLRTAG
jgi:dTDP-4-amino-4,6-dideoxygalactose transaminase